jgi:uncharacterized protein
VIARHASARAHSPLALGTLALCTSLGSAQVALAAEVPTLRARVNDDAQLLSAERAAALEARLGAHERATGQQLALLTLPSLEGRDLAELGIEIAEKWKLGDGKRDDGLIMLVARDERRIRIEVGYGLEGLIPDAVAARVIREVMAPAFQRGDPAAGIEAGFAVLIERLGGDPATVAGPSGAERSQPARERGGLASLLGLLFLAMLFGRRGGLGRGRMMRSAGLGGLAGGLYGGLGHRGGLGGFGGRGGGFGGRGGGCGGGGASGGW